MSDADRPIVSDHAVLRYLERVHGVDVEAIRDAIAVATSAGRETSLNGFPGIASVVGDCRFICEDGRVVTTLRRDQLGRRRREKMLTETQARFLRRFVARGWIHGSRENEVEQEAIDVALRLGYLRRELGEVHFTPAGRRNLVGPG